jgi:SAM-dependent methyltransferase
VRWPPISNQRLRRLRRPAWLGTLRRTSPLSDVFGLDRGKPVDRRYIEGFLARHRQDIRGRVLEVKDSHYTDSFGAGVSRRDVLDVDPTNRNATIVADLAEADPLPSDSFDCLILTQVLQFIFPVQPAIRHGHRALRPGGVLLVTVPGISRIEPGSLSRTDHWRFTPASCRRLFEDVFGPGQVSVEAHGNVLAAIAFLTGMAQEELSPAELDRADPHFPVVVAVRAVKRAGASPQP